MPGSVRIAFWAAMIAWGSACSARGPGFAPAPSEPQTPPPAPPVVQGPLAVKIVYPPNDSAPAVPGKSLIVHAREGYAVQARDSTFIFGTVGRGDARLLINGAEIPVYPTGAWLAWLPLPDDTIAPFQIAAVAGDQTVSMRFVTPIATRYRPPQRGAWIDTTSFSPSGDRWVRPGEGIRLTVRAAPGARVRGLVGDGRELLFLPDTTPGEPGWGQLAFGRDAVQSPKRPLRTDRYTAWWTGRLGPDPDLVLAPNFPELSSDSTWMTLEAVVGTDTARTRWPLRLGLVDTDQPTVVVINDDLRKTGTTDSLTPGRPSPFGTYHWFFPTGTVAVVSGRWNGRVRLQLSQTSTAWVNASEVYPLRPGTPPAVGTTRPIRLTPSAKSSTLRIPLPARVPYRVDETARELRIRLYGISADMDWIQYGGTDPFVATIEFQQPTEDETVIQMTLSDAVWGYRTRWEGTDLLLEIRRPPVIDPERPLRGRLIALDAGHPPGGAPGPTGITEPEVVLGVTQKAATLLEQHGARVILTRRDARPVDLYERIRAAEDADAEILVSVHANALPDGVNPFVNNGTSVYYFHLRSIPLARELNRGLVRQFGYPDLGIGRGDLALARPTWMPAALTEGLFMMLPEQEAVLMSEEGQWRYARGIVEGLASFLRARVVGEQ